MLTGTWPKKEARPKDRAHFYALRRNIFRKRQKTMGCLAPGEPDFALSIAFLRRRIDPAQHFLKVHLDGLVAETGVKLKRLAIAHDNRATPRFNNAFRLEGLDHAAGIGAADAEQGRKLLMRQRYDIGTVGALHRRDDPFGGALLDRMNRVAGRRLEHLRQQAIRVAREDVAQARRLRFRRFQPTDRQPRERPAEFDRDTRVGRQIALADNAADRTLTADQDGLDVVAVLAGHNVGDETRPAGKMHGLDMLAGAVKQVVRTGLGRAEPRLDQREVGAIEPAQQVVERPVLDLGRGVASRQHGNSSSPHQRDDRRSGSWVMSTSRQTAEMKCGGFPCGNPSMCFEGIDSGASSLEFSGQTTGEIMDAKPTGMPKDVLIVEDDPIIALDFEDTILG